ncbi:MAG: hypothetical protein EOP21_09600 [Hyphomicrobiales bacterium]|nr:MAG: hypothetical protein EOP21_09600 [Hyphomicrobiales bacterium]
MADGSFRNGAAGKRFGGYPIPQFSPDPMKTALAEKIFAEEQRKRAELARATPALRGMMIRDGREDYPHPRFNDNPMKSPVVKKLLAERRRQTEAEAAENLIPYNELTDTLGKLWAAPFTLAGSIAGAANVAAARLSGDEHAGISVRDNGIQFESGFLGQSDRAFTLGNAVLHGPGSWASKPNRRYDGDGTKATTSEHESGHSYRYQHPGFVADYVRYLVLEYLTGKPNPYEREADDFGDWKSRRRSGAR